MKLEKYQRFQLRIDISTEEGKLTADFIESLGRAKSKYVSDLIFEHIKDKEEIKEEEDKENESIFLDKKYFDKNMDKMLNELLNSIEQSKEEIESSIKNIVVEKKSSKKNNSNSEEKKKVEKSKPIKTDEKFTGNNIDIDDDLADSILDILNG